ncbi:MAG TPA: type VI secretion system ImpA family N-terminal domain-containing protein [Limnobacter sp.]|uniref:type VI secretion system protein TssA n=1 Tax=Limnobacter sp. TaxID=2003368 RepID=UPI002EDA72FD
MTNAAHTHNPDLQSAALVEPMLPTWSRPLPGLGCGPNLEYDNRFLALVQAAQGRPETQFEPAVPPDWAFVERESQLLLNESRDLRLVLLLAQSQLALQGLAPVPTVLAGMAALIRDCWTALNPPLDEGDAYPRLQVIESMGPGSPFFATLRSALVHRHAALGELRIRDFEILAGHLQGAVSTCNRDQLQQFMQSHADVLVELLTVVQSLNSALDDLSAAFAQVLPHERLSALESFRTVLRHVRQVLPELSPAVSAPMQIESGLQTGFQSGSLSEPAQSANPAPVAVLVVNNRAQALAAIDSVCRYLEQAEPTSPAQWLLKRARRLIDKNFLELVKDLAPDALNDVARIMGVDPRALDDPNF